jgi:hypothetical protein
MEVFYDPRLWDKPRAAVLEMSIQTFRKACTDQLKEYEELVGPADDEKHKDFKERKELGEGMIRYHAEQVAPELDYNHYRPVKVEVKFEVPIKHPETGDQLWCDCLTCWGRYRAYMATQYPEGSESLAEIDAMHGRFPNRWIGLPVSYGGRIDAIFEHIVTGQYYVVDWKTAATLAEESQRMMFLLLDDQITSYVWALNQCSVRVVGFIYHEQKKAFAVPPALLVRRYKGRLFSTAADQATSLEIFQKTVEENDPEGVATGAYDEYFDKLRDEPMRFHARYFVPRSDEELRQCGINIYKEAVEMVDANLNIYPNAGRFNCQTCAFNQPCLEQNSGGDVLYTLESLFEKRRYHYWEDKKPSTETKGGE